VLKLAYAMSKNTGRFVVSTCVGR